MNLFDEPRWRGGPRICVATNLPAFESVEAMSRFLAVNSPATTIIQKWECLKHAEELMEKFWKSPLARTVKIKIELPA